jgi:hypothetical protein
LGVRKLAPCYIGPFPITEKCGTVVYKLNLPPSLARVHDIFHVSQLNKCLMALVDIVLPEVTLREADLSYPELPIKVMDQKDHVMRHKESSSSRYNGATTLKKKKHGNGCYRSCYCRGKPAIVHCSCQDLSPFQNSGCDFLYGGGGGL